MVTDPIAIRIVQAIAITINEQVVWVCARVVFIRGVSAVVTSILIGATCDFHFVTNAITIGIVQASALTVEVVSCDISTRVIIICCCLVEVASGSVGTSFDFEFVTHAITISIRQALTEAVVAIDEVQAVARIMRGVFIVVASQWIRTSTNWLVEAEVNTLFLSTVSV